MLGGYNHGIATLETKAHIMSGSTFRGLADTATKPTKNRKTYGVFIVIPLLGCLGASCMEKRRAALPRAAET